MQEPTDTDPTKKTRPRHGPPAGGQFALVLETSTDVDVAATVQISTMIAVEPDEPDATFAKYVQKPQGKDYNYGEFRSFYLDFSLNYQARLPPSVPRLSENQLFLYWNTWFGLLPYQQRDCSYIRKIFISIDMLQNIQQFVGGFSLEHLPIGFKKKPVLYQDQYQHGLFDVVFEPPSRDQPEDPFAIPRLLSPESSRDPTQIAEDAQARQARFATQLRQLSRSQHAWWERLLAKHQQFIDNDDEFALLLSFQAFVQQVKNKGLSFDRALLTEQSFYDVTNMRTAMANMLTLLTHTAVHGNNRVVDKTDLQTQWTYMADLSLQSNGAIRLMYQHPECGVILPVMKIDALHYATLEQRQRYSLAGYGAHTDVAQKDNLDALSDDDFQAHFFRSIAAQKDRYPMAFYLQAAQKVHEFKLFHYDTKRQKNTQRALLQLLLRSTTGAPHYCRISEQEALDKWTSIVDLFQNFPMPDTGWTGLTISGLNLLSQMTGSDSKKEIPADIINDLYGLSKAPNLDALHRLSQLLSGLIKSLDLGALAETGQKLKGDFYLLNQLTEIWGQSVYEGMKFIELNPSVTTYQESFFHQYIGKLRQFTEAQEIPKDEYPSRLNEPNTKRYPLYLLSLISTFNLNPDDLLRLQNEIKPERHSLADTKKWTFALKALSKITRVKDDSGHRLNLTDLEYFIAEVQSTTEQDLQACIKKHFEAYFPVDYFLREIPASVSELIVNAFTLPADQRGVRAILEQLQLSGQWIAYEDIVKKIKQIVDIMPPIERSRFIEQLGQILPRDMKRHAPHQVSDQILALLEPLVHPRSRQAFTLFSDIKHNISKTVPSQGGFLQPLQCWLANQDELDQFIQDLGLPRAQATELSARLILNDTSMADNVPTNTLDELKEVLGSYQQVLTAYPAVSQNLWTFVQSYQQRSPNKLSAVVADFASLKNAFVLLDADQVLSLCFHFDGRKENGMLPGRTPHRLIQLLRAMGAAWLNDEQQRTVLSMLVALLNQEKIGDLNKIEAMIQASNKDFLLRAMKLCYASAPYPGLERFQSWCADDNLHTLQKARTAFCIQPCPRESNNGFDLLVAKKTTIKGITLAPSELAFLARYTEEVRTWTPEALQAKIQQYQSLNPNVSNDIKQQRLAALVAIVGELLYKIKSIEPEGTHPVPGSTYELNTTQYLAIYASLKKGLSIADVISEIGTGEGKSRCIAVVNACGLAQGKDVDCLTKPLELAIRDYLEYSAFYNVVCKTLGVQAHCITVDSPISHASPGLRISEVSHLQRFRNKAKIMGQENAVLNPDKAKRMLTIDEADLLRLHNREEKYTLSTAPDSDWQKMPWIYDAVMDFFAQDDERNDTSVAQAYLALTNAQPEAFLAFDSLFSAFVRTHYRTKKGFDEFITLCQNKPERLDELYRAAYQTRQLKYQDALGFEIKADVIQHVPQGTAQYSVAFPYADKVAKFSMGIQQCLAVLLNRYVAILKKSQQTPDSLSHHEQTLIQTKTVLFQKLAQCDTPFFVGVQKKSEYTSTNHDLFQDYQGGSVFCYTGTSGEAYEITELQSAAILKVPRHLGLTRKDKAIVLTNNHVSTLVNHIVAAMERGQPVLLFGYDDKSARALYKQLEPILQQKRPDNLKMQYVSSQDDGEDLATKVKRAGESTMLTIATEKFGRGTNIKLDAASIAAGGLVTYITYLPETERELEQLLSRSARFGDPGETRLILDTNTLQKWLGSSSLKRDFYLGPETFIQRLIARLNRRKQCERIIVDEIDGFNAALQDIVIKNIYPLCSNTVASQEDPSQKDIVRSLWAEFSRENASTWTNIASDLKTSLDPLAPDIEMINRRLAEYKNEVAERCASFQDKLVAAGLDQAAVALTLPPLVLSAEKQEILAPFQLDAKVPARVVTYREYDDAHNARAIVYSKPFVKLRAILRGERYLFADLYAWYRGEGVLWPNLRAWWDGKLGELSFFQALTSYHGTLTQFIMGVDTSELTGRDQSVEQASPHDEAILSDADSLEALFSDSVSASARITTALAGSVNGVAGREIHPALNHDRDLTTSTGRSAYTHPPHDSQEAPRNHRPGW